MTKKISMKKIREYYGHNGHECRVWIRGKEKILRYGSPNPTDRSRDYWQYLGTVEDAIRLIEIKEEAI